MNGLDEIDAYNLEDLNAPGPGYEATGKPSALYPGSNISCQESMLLIMSFCVRHKLSGVATEDLLRLLSLHCPENTNNLKSLKDFQLFVRSLKTPIVKHYYCPEKQCQVYNGTNEPDQSDCCIVCNKPLSKNYFFIELPIETQLQDLLSSK